MSLRRLYRSSPRLRRAVRRRKNAATFWIARLALWLPRQIGLERALSWSDRVGDLVFLLMRQTRRLALEHIESALGDELSPAAREQIVRASFRNIARSFCELANFDEIRPRLDQYVEVEGWQNIAAVREAGRGAIAITGHIGNWEILAAYFALRGIPVGAVARRIHERRLNDLIVAFRTRQGVETILRESPGASRQILNILKKRGVLAMLIDQDTKAPSVSVPFFGRQARTPAAAAALSIRRDLPVVPIFAQRRPEGGHRLMLLPPIYPPHTDDRRSDILEMTGAFNRVLEERVRENPAEWVWWHRRWRRAPVPNLDLDPEIKYSNTVRP
jgi:KDO2-lipid IV(A) lauroyltransferase